MFKKNYNDAFTHIKPDLALKEEILSKIEAEQNKKRNPAIPWRIGFALATAAAIVLSVLFIPKNEFVKKSTAEPLTLSATESYNHIYKIFKTYKSVKYNNFKLYGDVVEEYEYVTEDIAADTDGAAKGNSAQATKPTAQNDSTRGEDIVHSETTEQVEGVSEADIVKTDGKYIYSLAQSKIRIYKADGKDSALLSIINLDQSDKGYAFGEMFLNGSLLTVIQYEWYYGSDAYSSIHIYDIENPENPVQKYNCRQQGAYVSARMIGNFIYFVTDCNINVANISRDDPTTFVPNVECNDKAFALPAESIYCYTEDINESRYSVVGAYDITTGKLTSSISLLGGTDTIYCSTDTIIIADAQHNRAEEETEKKAYTYNSTDTVISQISINNGALEYKNSGKVGGALENQFFIDQSGNTFRFVTTVDEVTEKVTSFANSDKNIITHTSKSFARLTILDDSLNELGRLDRIAEGERVYSVRFMGDIAYFVTFRQTDPLFSADLSNPENPKLLGQLKIPGFSEYMYPYNDGLLLGFGMNADEKTGRADYLKLSMFDITNPVDLKEQDKTVLSPFTHSAALYNHKAMLVSVDKNLIGFPAISNKQDIAYMIYKYTDNGFVQAAAIDLSQQSKYKDFDAIRGLFIEDNFYVITSDALWSFDISSFSLLALIQ